MHIHDLKKGWEHVNTLSLQLQGCLLMFHEVTTPCMFLKQDHSSKDKAIHDNKVLFILVIYTITIFSCISGVMFEVLHS